MYFLNLEKYLNYLTFIFLEIIEMELSEIASARAL